MKGRLEQKLEQKQVLRIIPQQLQLGKMLELNDQELGDLINITVDENPALTITDSDKVPESDSSSDTTGQNEDTFSGYNHPHRADKGNIIEQTAGSDPLSEITNAENVLSQLNDVKLDNDTRRVAEYMAGCIDSNGYFTRTKSGIADDLIMQLGMEPTPQQLDKAWDTIRSFDPPGTGATDLRDCLLLQLERKPHNDVIASASHDIIANHFDDFLNRRSGKLLKDTGLSPEILDKVNKLISKLEPKPGRIFASESSPLADVHITPDFAILPDLYNEGRLTITSLSELPELSLDESFIQQSSKISGASEAALFIKQRCEDAGNFINLLKLRQVTLLKIIRYISERQKDYFLTGDLMLLKPMVLKDVAAATELDISVISRATSGRYVLTVAGIIALKSLFNEKKSTQSGEGATEMQITALLTQMINNEDPANPLTDDQLTASLQKAGYDIARRTVAKYREKAGISTARQRKNNLKI